MEISIPIIVVAGLIFGFQNTGSTVPYRAHRIKQPLRNIHLVIKKFDLKGFSMTPASEESQAKTALIVLWRTFKPGG